MRRWKSSVPTDDEVALQDAEGLERREQERVRRSGEVASEYAARIAATETASDLREVGAKLTPEVKATLVLQDLERVRALYAKRLAAFKTQPTEVGANGSD